MMKVLSGIVVCVGVVYFFITRSYRNGSLHPDIGLNTQELITRYGYSFENHTVITEDGYILELHRIPHGRNNTKTKNGAVLLQPSLLCNSAQFVNMGPENSLGFILADHGYDIWLANPRGTTWSRRHVKLDADKDKEYWNFSFHEMGVYDNAAIINYILSSTNEEQIFYIGHSQGATLFYILTSMKPEFNKHIRLCISLAPSAFIGRSESPALRLLLLLSNSLEYILEATGKYEVLPHTPLLPFVSRVFCNEYSPFQGICVQILFMIAGPSTSQLNRTTIPVIVSNIPAGASLGQMLHAKQLYETKRFRPFDYGEQGNLAKYGKITVEDYEMEKLTLPMAFFYAENDLLVSVADINHVLPKIPNLVFKKNMRDFNHLDVVWGIDAVSLVFNDILSLLEQY